MSKIPLQVGITGGIGSGKSLICRIFSCLGVPIYEADSRAIYLTNHHEQIRERVVMLLGSQAYDAAGQYDRRYVSGQVFGHPDRLKALNDIIHPIVREDTQAWLQKQHDVPYVIKEAAIMNAAGAGNTLDFVVVVSAPEALRIQRVMQRDQRAPEQIKAIIARQATEEQRQAIADFTIYNDEATPLLPQVLRLHQYFSGQI